MKIIMKSLFTFHGLICYDGFNKDFPAVFGAKYEMFHTKPR